MGQGRGHFKSFPYVCLIIEVCMKGQGHLMIKATQCQGHIEIKIGEKYVLPPNWIYYYLCVVRVVRLQREIFLVLPVTELTSASPRLLSSNLNDLDCLLGFEYPSYFTSSPGLVSFSNPVCLTFLLCLLSSCTAKSVGEGWKVLLLLFWVFLGGVVRLAGDGPSGWSLTCSLK